MHARGLTWRPISLPDTLIHADKRAIRKILVHLLSNAVKFTPAGGRMGVRVRRIGGSVNIYVEDSGVGIPKALPKLARPFEWVEMDATKPTDGSGLGLAIARSLAELHGGGLRIRSCEGMGTIVMLHLPAEPAGDRVRGDALRDFGGRASAPDAGLIAFPDSEPGLDLQDRTRFPSLLRHGPRHPGPPSPAGAYPQFAFQHAEIRQAARRPPCGA